jgi:hypothetical protein
MGTIWSSSPKAFEKFTLFDLRKIGYHYSNEKTKRNFLECLYSTTERVPNIRHLLPFSAETNRHLQAISPLISAHSHMHE